LLQTVLFEIRFHRLGLQMLVHLSISHRHGMSLGIILQANTPMTMQKLTLF
jgi:hypothetical protein